MVYSGLLECVGEVVFIKHGISRGDYRRQHLLGVGECGRFHYITSGADAFGVVASSSCLSGVCPGIAGDGCSL